MPASELWKSLTAGKSSEGTSDEHESDSMADLQFLRYTYPDYAKMSDEEIHLHLSETGRFELRSRNWEEALAKIVQVKGEIPVRFDPEYYVKINPDLAKEFLGPAAATWHYLAFGRDEGRSAFRQIMTIEDTNLRTYRVFDPIEICVDPDVPERFNVLIPAFEVGTMSAGFFGVFELASWLQKSGHRVRLVFFENFAFHTEILKESLRTHPGLTNLLDRVEVTYVGERKSPLRVSPHDRAVATVWYSAYLAEEIHRHTGQGPFLYLIQDDESTFHPNGSSSTLAASSYKLNFCAFVSSQSLHEHFKANVEGTIKENPERSITFNNAASYSHDHLSKSTKNASRTVAFYARPMVDRNAFDIGIQALRLAIQRGILDSETLRVVGIGIGDLDVEISEDVLLRQIPRLAIDEYRNLIGTFDLALSLMVSPHPSLVPIDLAGSGVPVVTNVLGTKSAEYLSEISSNIIPSKLEVEALVEGIRLAMIRVEDFEARREAALDLNWPTSWSEVFGREHEVLVQSVWSWRNSADNACLTESNLGANG